MTPEEKIAEAARKIFLKYGFHASTLIAIADLAQVSKAAIHYYFRSKDKLYSVVLKNLFSGDLSPTNPDLEVLHFLSVEMRTNKDMLINCVKNSGIDEPDRFIKNILSSCNTSRLSDLFLDD